MIQMRFNQFGWQYKIISVVACAGVLVACGPMSKHAALSEGELRAELTECNNIANPSNSKAIICQNYRHECESRMDRDGKFRDC